MNSDVIYCVRIVCADLPADSVAEILESLGYEDHSLWEDEASGTWAISFCREASAEALQLKESLAALFDEKGLVDVTIEIQRIEKEDWTSSWKKFFHAAKVSSRIVVRPSWEEWRGRKDDIQVIIDPGMSFGTGLHPTTRGCISFLDEVSVPGGSFLDAGCGSGILSICAAKLGYGRVDAFDIDPVAVECAKANLAANGVSAGVCVACMRLEEYQIQKPFDTVAVNILAPVILANCDNICGLLATGGKLLLAGILTVQFEELAEQFETRGLLLLERIDDEEWTSGLFELANPVSRNQ